MQQRSRDVVYIIDTDASVRQGLARLLDSAGLEAIPCDSTAAFFHHAPTGRRACGLLDIAALLSCDPGQWAELRAAAQSMPIIALSADDDPATRQMARAMGARAFFRKPVDAAALFDSIDWVMHTEGWG